MPHKLYCLLLPALAFSSVQPYSDWSFNSTVFWWAIHLVILFGVLRVRFLSSPVSTCPSYGWVNVYLAWNVISICHGVLVAESYWDWKFLADFSMALLLPAATAVSLDTRYLRYVLWGFVWIAIPSFSIVFFLVWKDAYGFYLAVLPLFTLALPLLPLRWRVVVISLSVSVLLADLGARSNVIKFALPFLFLVFYVFRTRAAKAIVFRVINTSRVVLLFLPFVLFGLAASGGFNVFNFGEYVGDDFYAEHTDATGAVFEDDLKADTRTFLYYEVIETALKNDSWLIGRSPARGSETEAFLDLVDAYGRAERPSNEAAILNVFTWTGLIGVILYWAVFFAASRNAVLHSNNLFCKIVGLFVSFRWVYAWVEDINIFNLNYIFVWILIGICFSKPLLKMSDCEISLWLRSVLLTRGLKDRYAPKC